MDKKRKSTLGVFAVILAVITLLPIAIRKLTAKEEAVFIATEEHCAAAVEELKQQEYMGYDLAYLINDSENLKEWFVLDFDRGAATYFAVQNGEVLTGLPESVPLEGTPEGWTQGTRASYHVEGSNVVQEGTGSTARIYTLCPVEEPAAWFDALEDALGIREFYVALGLATDADYEQTAD